MFKRSNDIDIIFLCGKQCADIDECELGQACGPGSICTNTDGGFQCSCPPGFSGDPKIGCVDIDECVPNAKSAPVCGRSALCDNLPGTFRCQCPPGFKGDPKVACEGVSLFLIICLVFLLPFKLRIKNTVNTNFLEAISLEKITRK